MSSLVLSRGEEHVVRIDVRVEDMEWYAEYDRLEVHRSVLGEGGPYEELTAETWERAAIPATATSPSMSSGPLAALDGKKLELLVNETHVVSVTFTGTITHATAAEQLALVATPLLYPYVDTNSRLAIRTQALGGAAAIRVVDGDAAPILGLELGSVGYGADPRPQLVEGKRVYRVTDYFSRKEYFYKTRFYNSQTGVRSEFSQPFAGKAYLGVRPENIIRGYVKLVQRDGRPNPRQQVALYNAVLGQQVEGAAIMGGKDTFLTDDDGYLEVDLIRGMVIDIGLTGTSLMRKVTVPTDPRVELFDLLSPAVGTDDAFTVKRVDTIYAERRTT